MQSEVGYLFSSYGREGRREEEQRGSGGREGRDRSCLSKRETEKRERLRLQAGRKTCLPQQMGKGVEWLVS